MICRAHLKPLRFSPLSAMLALVNTPWSLLPSLHITHHTSHITHHTSHITRQMPHVTHHTSHITCCHHDKPMSAAHICRGRVTHWHTTGTLLVHARYSLLPRLGVQLARPLVQDFRGLILQSMRQRQTAAAGAGDMTGKRCRQMQRTFDTWLLLFTRTTLPASLISSRVSSDTVTRTSSRVALRSNPT